MQKTLKALSALAILSCVVYALGQSSPSKSGQGGVANPAGARKYQPLNGAQIALREYIMAINNRNSARADEEKRPGIGQACTDVQCYYWLATARPDERKYTIDEVWQLSTYRPNGQWNHITSAPILVVELLRVDPAKSKKMDEIVSTARSKWMEQFDWKDARLDAFKGKLWKDFTQEEKDRYYRINEENRQRWLNGRTTADVRTEHAVYMIKAINEAKNQLTPVQLSEFDSIIAAYDKDMALAFAGKKPSFVKGN